MKSKSIFKGFTAVSAVNAAPISEKLTEPVEMTNQAPISVTRGYVSKLIFPSLSVGRYNTASIINRQVPRNIETGITIKPHKIMS